MIYLEFTNLHTDLPLLLRPEDAILGVVADFSVLVGDRLLYSEVEFPVVEFSRSILSWLGEGRSSGNDFEYESAEAAEVGLVWLRRHGKQWRVGSINQEYPEMTTFTMEEISAAADDFIGRLQQACVHKLGIDVSTVLRNEP